MLATDTFDFLGRVDACEERTEISALLHSEICKLGFNGVSLCWLPEPGSRQRAVFEVQGLPKEYHEHYSQRHYERYSPVVRHMQSNWVPFVRSQVSYDPNADPMAHRVMTEARNFGIHDAWVIPVYSDNRLSGWVCASTDNKVLPQDKVRQLHVMALWAHSHAGQLPESNATDRPRLSPREREVVSWLASGKTADDIACILGLSPRTVEYHIANAGLKLGTLNRTHTVVEAIRLKQIHI